MTAMKMSAEGRKALTEQFEGYRLVAYADPGTGSSPFTIGYGHTKGVKRGDTCTQAQADEWLASDVLQSEVVVNRVVKVKLTQHEFDALVDFVFNLGDRLTGSTLLRLLNAGDYAGAANEFEKWDRAAGKVMAGLLRRRTAERDYFNAPDMGKTA